MPACFCPQPRLSAIATLQSFASPRVFPCIGAPIGLILRHPISKTHNRLDDMLATKLPLRLAAGASRAYTRVQSLSAARPLPRALESSHNAIAVSRRSYATPGRPKKAVGEASKTVKRTPKTTTTATKTKPKAATPKKAVAKKPKKAKKPIKPKKIAKPKPVKTEEQKVAAKVKAEKLLIKELKKLALDPPPRFRNVSAYNIFFREQMQLKGSDRPFGGELTKQIAADYMSLTPTEVEVCTHELLQSIY